MVLVLLVAFVVHCLCTLCWWF